MALTALSSELPKSLIHKSSGGDMRSLSQVLEPSDPSHHEAASGQFHPSERTGQGPLHIPGQTAATPHPRKRAFHYPTTR